MKFTQELLPEGYSVKYWVLNPRGARRITVAAVCNHQNETLSTGHAICNPTDDFNPERGRFIAEGRALKSWWLRENHE